MNTKKNEKIQATESKEVKSVKKSSYSKKKKVKKNILNGTAFVLSTFNNTIISISDTNGNVVSWSSAGPVSYTHLTLPTIYSV